MTRSERTRRPNVMNARCPSRPAPDLIADKWTMLIVRELAEGVRRPGALLRAIDGISRKMLTQTLRDLERDGSVTRTIYAQAPPKVEYTPCSDSRKEQDSWCRLRDLHCEGERREKQRRRMAASLRYPQ